MGGIGELFSPRTPKAPEPVKMPDPEDPAKLEAERRKRATATGSGRASTVLGESGAMEGGSGVYQKTLLGGG